MLVGWSQTGGAGGLAPRVLGWARSGSSSPAVGTSHSFWGAVTTHPFITRLKLDLRRAGVKHFVSDTEFLGQVCDRGAAREVLLELWDLLVVQYQNCLWMLLLTFQSPFSGLCL